MTQSASAPLPASVLEALARYDTPTICNAMEIVAPERRLIGYTTKPLVCPFPDLPPMVGYARTVTIRSVLKSGLPAEEASKRRIDYYEYMGTGHGPRITVIQDIDGPDVGYGAFWGEVQSNVHKALGCLGVITDGSIRDIPQWAPGFQALAGSVGPSHASPNNAPNAPPTGPPKPGPCDASADPANALAKGCISGPSARLNRL